MGKRCLPEHLKDAKHWDYPKPFRWIPRSWTSFCWGKPKKVLGNQEEKRKDAPAPIGEKGSWQVSRFPDAPGPLKYIPLYFAVTLKNGRHFRIGARWDDVDSYVTFPSAATRKYSGGDGQDTSTF